MSRMMIDRALAALLRALKPELGEFRIEEAESTAWASATFAGGRHVATLELAGADGACRAATVADGIAEREFALPGLLVADIAAARMSGASLTIEALILEDL